MNILNIHGYHGSRQNAAFSALKENRCENIISPDINYDAVSPEKVREYLAGIIRENDIGLIVGTSLGGFFAAVLSAELGIPVILVNPCLMPFLHLPRLGYTGDIKPFISLFGNLTGLDSEKTSCIIGGSDDVIDTHDFTENLLKNPRFRVIPDGKHSGATLPLKEYFSGVLRYYSGRRSI